MSVKISTTNSKLGVIPSVNQLPIVTCRPDCPCAQDCYARKGRFRFPNVYNTLLNNYDEYIRDPDNYFEEIKNSIDNGFIVHAYFRWHASGDIIDDRYFLGMVKIANELPMTSFLVFTKQFEIVNRFIHESGDVPHNLHIVFSAWGDDLEVINPYNFPVAYVRFHDKDNSNVPDDALECSGDCTKCLQCWNIHKGQSVVFNKH